MTSGRKSGQFGWQDNCLIVDIRERCMVQVIKYIYMCVRVEKKL